jgi:nickel-dependent lactate racemase
MAGFLRSAAYKADPMEAQTVIGTGYLDRTLGEQEIRALVTAAFDAWNLTSKRVLVIIPDRTRSAPIPLFFRLISEILQGKAAALDYLVALGTHPRLDEAGINQLVGITPEERRSRYAWINLINHRWDLPETFVEVGTISPDESLALSNGMLSAEIRIRINRLVLDYDIVLICGPVFPHEVAGFSGGNKYLFPGISGAEVINFSHWLGALITSYETIGIKHTPVRAVIDRAAESVPGLKRCLSFVVKDDGLAGLYIGEPREAWSAAADLSARLHIRYVDRPFRQVLSMIPRMYDDLWTGAKGMYKLEPVVAAGGEVILYAPHITEISYTHGHILDEIGYHVRDYFVKQWDRFRDYPWGVLAHSTHLRGIGAYDDGIERPRIRVTLATGIPRERCELVNLGYRDPATIQPEEWGERREDDILLVPHAGEYLYRLKSD